MQLAKLSSPSHLDGPARKTTINGTACYYTAATNVCGKTI